MNGLIRAFFYTLLRFFYPDRRVRGQAPERGPCIVVANHPNALLDPPLLAVGLRQPMAFLAKSTLLDMPVMRRIMLAFRAIPVYRAKEADPAKNSETFARARALLAEGGWLALFPEGVSHDGTSLLPLKTGAARLALGGPPGIRIVPVGLTYEDKAIFRSAVAMSIGPALSVDNFRRIGGEAPEDVRALTEAIDDAIRNQMLEAEDQEIWRGFRNVASWLAAPGEPAEQTEARALEFSRAWKGLDAPTRVAMAAEARAFAGRLAAVGIADPWLLDAGLPGPAAVVRAAAPLVLLAPIAAVGAVLGWLPYRGIGILVGRLTQETDAIATYKLLGGALILPLWWGVQAALLAWWNPWVGMSALVLGPLAGFVALRWDERLQSRRRLGRAWWLLWTERGVAEAVRAEREKLAARVRDVVRQGR